MSVNRGKQFEEVIKKAFEEVEDTIIVRLADQTNGYVGSKNPCDFLVYRHGHFYAIECKTIHGNTFPFTNITDYQYSEISKIASTKGCYGGILCWWVDKDVTRFIPIQLIQAEKQIGAKSIRYDYDFAYYNQETGKISSIINLKGTKKRVFFDYDIYDFFSNFE